MDQITNRNYTNTQISLVCTTKFVYLCNCDLCICVLGSLHWSSPKTHLHITHLHISSLCKYVNDTMKCTQNPFAQKISRDFSMVIFIFIFSRDLLVRHEKRYNRHRIFTSSIEMFFSFVILVHRDVFQELYANGCCHAPHRRGEQYLHPLALPQRVLYASF